MAVNIIHKKLDKMQNFKELSEIEKRITKSMENIFLENPSIRRDSYVKVLFFLANKYKKKRTK